MLKLKDFLQVVDENTLCKLQDINGKLLTEPYRVYELSLIKAEYLDYHVIHCLFMNNFLYIILDMDIRL